MATHAAAHLAKLNHKISEFYTFGSPRVGNSKFSQWFDNVVPGTKIRVTRGHDPVPHLPLHEWLFNHVVHEFFYPGATKNGFVECKDTTVKEDPSCSEKNKIDVNVLDHVQYYDIDFTGIVLGCQV